MSSGKYILTLLLLPSLMRATCESEEDESLILNTALRNLDQTKIQQHEYYTGCREVPKNETGDIYLIKPKYAAYSFKIKCNMELMDGGWTYILNRIDDSQDFALEWKSYKRGFGDMNKNFWLGLDHIYYLTNEGSELLVYLINENDEKRYAYYSDFRIGREEEGYILKELSGYNGTAGNSLYYSLGMKFSTTDLDQDEYQKENCANIYGQGPGWWYKACTHSLLTGKYLPPGPQPQELKAQGIFWSGFGGNRYSFKQAMMLVRPANTTN